MLASNRNGTLYVGVTSDFVVRISEHKQGLVPSFTKRHGAHRLVYIEFHESMEAAIAREKRIKRWHRAWKIELIEKANPEWRDIYPEMSGLVAPMDVSNQR